MIFDSIQISPGWFLLATEKETALVDHATLVLLLKQLLLGGRT